VADDFIKDALHYRGANWKQKLWAYRRGFLSDRIARYGLTESNYRDYCSDVAFYRREMYKNMRLSYWYDDKLTTLFLLRPFEKWLPVHYYSIEDGKVRQLYRNGNGAVNNSVDGICEALRANGELAFKASKGGHGRGFFKMSCRGSQYWDGDTIRSETEVRQRLSGLNGYIITEFCHPHHDLRRVCADAPCVLRVVTICDDVDGAQLTASCLRIGTKVSGHITDYDGTIFCGVTLDEGEWFRPLMATADNTVLVNCDAHPDTGARIAGSVPHWKLIAAEVIKISNYLNCTPYLTYDVVSTDDGFKILEINSHGMLRIMQPFYPFFRNQYTRRLFAGSVL